MRTMQSRWWIIITTIFARNRIKHKIFFSLSPHYLVIFVYTDKRNINFLTVIHRSGSIIRWEDGLWFLSRKYLAREYEVLGFVFSFHPSSIIVFLTADTQTRKGHTSAASCNCSVSSDSCNNRAMAWRNTSAELVTKQPPGPTFAEQVRPWPRGRQGGRTGGREEGSRCYLSALCDQVGFKHYWDDRSEWRLLAASARFPALFLPWGR